MFQHYFSSRLRVVAFGTMCALCSFLYKIPTLAKDAYIERAEVSSQRAEVSFHHDEHNAPAHVLDFISKVVNTTTRRYDGHRGIGDYVLSKKCPVEYFKSHVSSTKRNEYITEYNKHVEEISKLHGPVTNDSVIREIVSVLGNFYG